jgi:hypothetical protein
MEYAHNQMSYIIFMTTASLMQVLFMELVSLSLSHKIINSVDMYLGVYELMWNNIS